MERKESKGASEKPTAGLDVASGEVLDDGQHAQHLEQSFNLWSTLGIQFSITATPLCIGTYLSVSIGTGGGPVFFFGYIVAVGLNLLVCASLAEIAAVHPHASGKPSAGTYSLPLARTHTHAHTQANTPSPQPGQIYWTALFAPKRYSRVLSYVTGWMACAAWFFWTAASCLITSQLLWALVQVCHPEFVLQAWHYYLVYVAAAVVALAMNIPLFGFYSLAVKGLTWYINAGALFVLIALLVRAHPKASAAEVFTQFVNGTGWSSDGVVFFLGLLPGAAAVNGFDCATHMSDEMPNPARNVPKVMLGSALLSAPAGLLMVVVYLFCNVNPDGLLAPIADQPIAQLLLDALRSQPLTIVGLLIYMTCLLAACFSCMTTFSRVWWTLSREGGVPLSPLMSRVSDSRKLPVASILFSFFAVVLIGLIELGSATALNAILGSGVICIYISYIIPIACLLLDKRRHIRGKRSFSLGRAGWATNIIALAWMSMESVWLLFPTYQPVTASSMNYAVAVVACVVLVSAANWSFYSRKVFFRSAHSTIQKSVAGHDIQEPSI